jgi:hypothetical protein
MKNFLAFVLTVAIGIGVGFAAGKAYIYFTKKPCGCTEKQKQVEEWNKTPDFLKKSV